MPARDDDCPRGVLAHLERGCTLLPRFDPPPAGQPARRCQVAGGATATAQAAHARGDRVRIVGIDSGTTGAFSVIDTAANAASVHDLPMEAVQVGERMLKKLDALAFARMLRRLCPVEDGAVAYLETLHARGTRNDG